MPKRSRSKADNSDEYLRRKLRKLEKKLQNRRKRPVLSSSSSSSVSPVPSLPEDVVNEQPIELDFIDPLYEVHDALDASTVQEPAREVPDAQADSLNIDKPAEQTPELDEEIMKILGETPSKEKKYGTDIQKDIAIRWEHIATSGLSKEARKELVEKHITPGNCKKIDAPLLNPETKAALSDSLLKKDKALENKQKQLAAAISCIGEALTLILSSEHKDPNILKLLIEAGRIMCDSQHTESLTRRSFICSTIKKELKDQLYDTEIDKFLFGEKLAETLKAAKAINKSATDMKVSAPFKAPFQKNRASTSKNSKTQYPNSRPPALTRRPEPAPVTATRAAPAMATPRRKQPHAQPPHSQARAPAPRR